MEKRVDLTEMGSIVKMYRIKNGFTQEELSEGICTPSYLSRIENSHVMADIEIYQLLFQRMDMAFNEFYQEHLNMESKLEDIYTNLLNKKHIDQNEVELLKSSLQIFFKKEFHIKAKLVYARYLMTLGSYKEVELIIADIKEVIEYHSNRNTFIYVNVAIPFYYLINKQKEAMQLLNKATKIEYLTNNGNNFEIACYYYNISLVLCKEYKYSRALVYCQKALSKFSEIYQPELDFKCHILLGVTKNNLAQYEDAIQHYKICLNIIKNTGKMDNQKSFNMVYSNLGYSYECQRNFKNSLYYYEKAFDYSFQIEDYINLIRCHYQDDNMDAALTHLNEALLIPKTTELKYQYQIDIFSFILLGQLKNNNVIENLEEESLSYFKENQYYTLVIFYSKVFARFYSKVNWYKKSSQLFELALETSENLMYGKKEK